MTDAFPTAHPSGPRVPAEQPGGPLTPARTSAALDEAATAGPAPAVAIATAAALVLVAVYLGAPLMGGDLSAQFAHSDFARAHPLAPVDLRWFGGVLPFAYSLWTPPVMALIGVRLTGALATVAAVALFTVVLGHGRARRPAAGGVAAAVTLTSSLAEGRVTFACGLAFALASLVLVARAAARDGARAGGARTPGGTSTRVAGALAAVVAGAASPVVSVFLLVAAGALAVRGRLLDAAVLATSAVPLVVVALLFSDPGRQVFGAHDAVRAVIATALVIVMVPAHATTLRSGAAIGLVMVLAAIVLPTPLGSNSARLSLLFAVPVVAAFVAVRGWLVALAVAAVVVAQTPVTFGTLSGAGRPVTRAAYFAPLERELSTLGRTGRVEVPELTGHWEAAYLARHVPLARGWLRQTDTELNDDVFYRRTPTAASYRAFLDRSAVQFVAVADARATFYGRREIALVTAGVDYLRPVWRGAHWTLYAVADPTPVVSAPGELVAYFADRIELRAPAGSVVPVRIRWFEWLTVDAPGPGACLTKSADGVSLRTGPAGTYQISSSLAGGSRPC